MAPVATIVIPTHDHGATLAWSVPSALAQTVADVEVFVVGDGVPDVSREIVHELARHDERVRFFDNPKGPRHGEIHRHAALAEASGRVVCYLSDDDLFLPDHVERVLEALDEADFTHSLPLAIGPSGEITGWLVDLAMPFYVALELGGQNRIPLSCAAHTLDLYRRLPHGWRTTPQGIWTDLYMWQQFLGVEGARFASGTHATVLHFPSPDRVGWSSDERVAELARWASTVAQPGFRERWNGQVLDWWARYAARLEEQVERFRVHSEALEGVVAACDERVGRLLDAVAERDAAVAGLTSQVAARDEDAVRLAGQVAERDAVLARMEAALQEAHAATAGVKAELDRVASELAAVRATRTWRWHDRAAAHPVLGRLVRTVARAPFGRAGR